MKFTAIAIATLLPFTALAAPTAEAEGGRLLFAPEVEGGLPVFRNVEARSLEKRAITATVVADALKHRQCPRTSCTADGQYSRGTHIKIRCFTDQNTSTINGNPLWGKLQASGVANNNWVSLYYVTWDGGIPEC